MRRAALGLVFLATVGGGLALMSAPGAANPGAPGACPDMADQRCPVPEPPEAGALLDLPGDSLPGTSGSEQPLTTSTRIPPSPGPTSTATATATPEPSPTATVTATVPAPVPTSPSPSPTEPSPGNRHWAPMVGADGPLPTPTPTLTPTVTPTPQGPVLYLTFDDGPHPTWTQQVLAVLDRYDAQATFFELGTNVNAYPSIARQVRDAGHAVANHSYTHKNLTGLSWYGARDELSWTNTAIAEATGDRPSCMRPPYGATNATVKDAARALGLEQWLWTVDPEDWKRPGSNVIAQRVTRTAGDGDIVLMHDGGGNRSQTVAALEEVLGYYSARGYRFEALPGC